MKQILGLCFIILYGLFVRGQQAVETSICIHNQTGQRECCHDYRNVSGVCKACIGSWGKNCQRNCSFGFYGHGCRQKCSCSLQDICDRRDGCIVTKLTYNVTTKTSTIGGGTDFHGLEIGLLSAIGVGILILLIWRSIPYLYRCLTKMATSNNRTKEINSVKTNSVELHDQESYYSALRESKFVKVDDSRDILNPWSRQHSRGPVISSFKKSRRMENTLGEMGYNRVHLKQHHILQEDTMTYDYCSDGVIVRPFSATRKPTLKNSSASERIQEFSEDNENINFTEKRLFVFKGKYDESRPYSTVRNKEVIEGK